MERLLPIFNCFYTIDPVPKIEDTLLFMKSRHLYDPWKVHGVRFYTKRFPAKRINWESAHAKHIMFCLGHTPRFGRLRGLVEIGNFLYGIDDKRKYSGLAYELCSSCNWITPHGHSPECDIGMLEKIHDE